MMTVWSSMGCPRSPTPPRRRISGSSGAYGWLESTSSRQPPVFPTIFSGRRRDPRGLRNQAPAIFLHERLSLSWLTSHIALFFVLSDSRYFLSHHQHVLGCKSRDSQRRRPLVDQLALCLTRVVLLPNYQEDEAMLREPLEDIGRSLLAEKHARIAFTLEVRTWRVTISSRTRGPPIIC